MQLEDYFDFLASEPDVHKALRRQRELASPKSTTTLAETVNHEG